MRGVSLCYTPVVAYDPLSKEARGFKVSDGKEWERELGMKLKNWERKVVGLDREWLLESGVLLEAGGNGKAGAGSWPVDPTSLRTGGKETVLLGISLSRLLGLQKSAKRVDRRVLMSFWESCRGLKRLGSIADCVAFEKGTVEVVGDVGVGVASGSAKNTDKPPAENQQSEVAPSSESSDTDNDPSDFVVLHFASDQGATCFFSRTGVNPALFRNDLQTLVTGAQKILAEEEDHDEVPFFMRQKIHCSTRASLASIVSKIPFRVHSIEPPPHFWELRWWIGAFDAFWSYAQNADYSRYLAGSQILLMVLLFSLPLLTGRDAGRQGQKLGGSGQDVGGGGASRAETTNSFSSTRFSRKDPTRVRSPNQRNGSLVSML